MRSKETIQSTGKNMSTPLFIIGILVATILMAVAVVYIGKSDSGEINVADTIRNSNQANREANGDAAADVGTVPEAFRNMPNGGLVAQENQNTETPPPVETGTTTEGENTEQVSTTTDSENTETENTDTSAEVSGEESTAPTESAEPISQ